MSHEMYQSRLNLFVNTLNNSKKIEEIADIISQQPNVIISLCASKIPEEKKAIHLLVESSERTGFFKLAELITPIKKIMGYDYSIDDIEELEGIITIHRKIASDPNKEKEVFSDMVRLSKDNLQAIHTFLTSHFPDSFKEEDRLKSLGKQIFDQNLSGGEPDNNLAKFLIEIMSYAASCGCDTRKVLHDVESGLSSLQSTPRK